nr:YcnI family protein [Petropleomorpha daqingensis]
MPRPATRLGIVLVALVGLLFAGLGVASAHVSVSSPDATQGGYGKIVFRVPNESDTASTVKLRIQLPTDHPFASVSTEPMPGWTTTLTRTALNPPEKDDDGNEITEAVSVVEFAADPGNPGIGPGQFQEFSLSVGPFPDAKALSFAAVQTYSDGTETAWIDPTVEGQPEPDHPAPTLTVGASSSSSSDGGSSSASSSSDGSSSTGTVALILSIVALVLGGAGVVLGLRAGRRTVSS